MKSMHQWIKERQLCVGWLDYDGSVLRWLDGIRQEAIAATLGFCIDRVGAEVLGRYDVNDVLELEAEAEAWAEDMESCNPG